MATLSRVTGKLFGGSAPLDEIGQFGSAKAGSLYNTQDVATIQSLPAYSNGWGSAIITSRNFPPIEEVTGVLKTLSYQNCYLLQEGVPVYDIGTEYSATSIVKVVNGSSLDFYISLVDGNIGNSLSDGTKWVKATFGERTIGEIVTSAIPLSDSGLHLLDGSLLSGSGIYAQFVSYIADIYNSSLNYFCSEIDWQTSVTTYGVCGKFVYDSTNNTVRLPKVTGIIEGTTDVTALGDLVEAGLPNITGGISGLCNNSSSVPTTSGALNLTNTYTTSNGQYAANYTYFSGGNVNLDASNSSSIYGNSTTVQPQTIKAFYYIVVASSTKTNIEVDIDEIATDLNGKADVDLTNTTPAQTFVNTSIDWMMPDWSKAVSKTANTDYTADQRGWVQASGHTVGDGVHLYINGYRVASCEAVGGDDESSFGCLVPVSIGDIYKLSDTGNGTVDSFNFIPCKGEA